MAKVLGEANAGELTAWVGVEEMAVGGAAMAARGRAAAAAQHELAAHKLAIIFADRARRGAETGIGAVGAAGPFPHAAEHLLQVRVAVLRRRLDRAGRIELLAAIPIATRGRRLPFLFGGQARAGPAREGVAPDEPELRTRPGAGAIPP